MRIVLGDGMSSGIKRHGDGALFGVWLPRNLFCSRLYKKYKTGSTVDIQGLQQRIAQGDTSAFSALVIHLQGPMFAFLGRMGVSQQQAKDLAQEAFLRAWQRRAEFDASRASWTTWVFTIAKNLALNDMCSAYSKLSPWPSDAENQFMSESNGPLEQLEAHQTRERVRQGIRALSTEDRSAIALAYINELDLAQIARIEGCSTNTMKVRIHRARQRLRKWLEEHP